MSGSDVNRRKTNIEREAKRFSSEWSTLRCILRIRLGNLSRFRIFPTYFDPLPISNLEGREKNMFSSRKKIRRRRKLIKRIRWKIDWWERPEKEVIGEIKVKTLSHHHQIAIQSWFRRSSRLMTGKISLICHHRRSSPTRTNKNKFIMCEINCDWHCDVAWYCVARWRKQDGEREASGDAI